MKYGIREICEVVLRAKGTMDVGNKRFYKDEPILYFDTLKTSSLEGSSTTVYAQGGRGNARLMSWDGDKTTTFTMEDALISPEGLMILAGAGLINAGAGTKALKQHITETVAKVADATAAAAEGGAYVVEGSSESDPDILTIQLPSGNTPVHDVSDQDTIYVMLKKDGEIVREPYIGTFTAATTEPESPAKIEVKGIAGASRIRGGAQKEYVVANTIASTDFDSVIVDYYILREEPAVTQVEITPDSFSGSFYLEASTLFRNEDGIDVPAEFIIPNCRVQSNFSFSMAATGDPSTFTFTLDCFPDYTRWDPTKKVLAAIQIIPKSADAGDYRVKTNHNTAAG